MSVFNNKSIFVLQLTLLFLNVSCFIIYILFNINYKILSIKINLFLLIFFLCTVLTLYLYEKNEPFLKNCYIILLICQIIINITLFIFVGYLLIIKYPTYLFTKNIIFFERRILSNSELVDLIHYVEILYKKKLTLPEIEWLMNVSKTFTEITMNLFEIEKNRMIYNYLESNAMYLALMVDSQSKKHTAQEIFNFIKTNVLSWIGLECLGLQRPLTEMEVISYCVFFSCLISGYMLSKTYQTKSIESYKNFIEPKKPTNSQLFVESEFQNLSQEETDVFLILKKSAQEQKTNSIVLLEEERILKEFDPNISKIISKEFLKKPPLRRGRDRFWETFARECNHMGDEKSGYYGAHHLWSGRITESSLPKNNTLRMERFFEFDHRVLLKLKKRIKKNIDELDKKIESLFNMQLYLIENKNSNMIANNLEELKYFIQKRNMFIEKYLIVLELYENIFSYNSNPKIFEKYLNFFYPLDSFKNLKESSEQIEIPKLFERGSRLDWLHRRCDRFHYPLCHESEPDSTVHFNTQIFGSENTIGFEETFFENQQDIDLFKLIDLEYVKKNFTTSKTRKIEISIEKHYNLYNVPIETSILQWDAFDRRFNIDKVDFLLSSFY